MIKNIIFTSGYLEGDDDLTEMKGHRSDVLAENENNEYYELNFINLSRLEVELRGNLEKGKNYFTDTGLIILNEISKDSIMKAVQSLDERKYFINQKSQKMEPSDEWFVIRLW